MQKKNAKRQEKRKLNNKTKKNTLVSNLKQPELNIIAQLTKSQELQDFAETQNSIIIKELEKEEQYNIKGPWAQDDLISTGHNSFLLSHSVSSDDGSCGFLNQSALFNNFSGEDIFSESWQDLHFHSKSQKTTDSSEWKTHFTFNKL